MEEGACHTQASGCRLCFFFAIPLSQHPPDACKDFRAFRVQRHHLGYDVLRIAQLVLVGPIGMFHREDIGRLVDCLCIDSPRILAVLEFRLQRDEFLQVVIIERIGLAEVAAGIELVKPDFARRRALLEDQHDGLDARAKKRAARLGIPARRTPQTFVGLKGVSLKAYSQRGLALPRMTPRIEITESSGPDISNNVLIFIENMVPRGGIEPPTLRFSVACSTN
jgi:hypothetical protein